MSPRVTKNHIPSKKVVGRVKGICRHWGNIGEPEKGEECQKKGCFVYFTIGDGVTRGN